MPEPVRGDQKYLPGLDGLRALAVTAVVASALYVSNWWYLAQHASYYAQFAPPGVLDHLWSLAVEERFYLVWPWLVLFGGWGLGRRRGSGFGRLRRGERRGLAAGTLVLAAVSAVVMALLYRPGSTRRGCTTEPTRGRSAC
jgi:peptidoglycan/LPS O-acetylase OafA/YrhL